MTKTYLDNLTYRILGAAIEVHKHLGPGLLESVYQKCLMRELELRNIEFKSQILTELNYKECLGPAELRCDLLVENAIVIELKACESTLPVHEGSYLPICGYCKNPKGF